MKKITIGTVQKPFGLKGELKIRIQTDFVEERFSVGNQVYINLNGVEVQRKIESVRKHQGSLLVKFEGLDSLTEVEHYHRALIQIDQDEMHDLDQDEYYFIDLIHCEVYVDQNLIGTVKEVMDMPAHPVLRIKTNDTDVLIPFVESFIVNVDLDSKRIDVKMMEGLF